MPRHWKRFCLMVGGTLLALNAFNDGPNKPANDDEWVVMQVVGAAIFGLGVWMVVRGMRLRPPDDPPAG